MRATARRRWLRSLTFCASIAPCLFGTAPHAHEIGTTRVSVLFRDDRTYEIEIVTDAAALTEKLEAVIGRPPREDARSRVIDAALADA